MFLTSILSDNERYLVIEYFSYAFNVVLLFSLGFALYYTYKFSLLLLDIQDIIEESLDDLEESFINLNKILEKPIFFDSIEVRQCVTEIKRTRSVVIKIADRLTSFGSKKEDVELKLDNKEIQQEKKIEGKEEDKS